MDTSYVFSLFYIKSFQVFSMRDPLEEERKKFFFDVLLEKPLNPVVSPPVLQSGKCTLYIQDKYLPYTNIVQ